ncbi:MULTISPECIES: hypothetical protein [Brachybacterium]|uniref:hypothetical protein n=1 Tax=Brachybacterium TaxID=43668 RepID=UPI0006B56197|nr:MULTISPECIES: hypothetical protein [Brachybacterium]
MTAEIPEGFREVAAAGALASMLDEDPSPLITLTDEELFTLYGREGEGRFASPWLDRLAVDRGQRFDVGMLTSVLRRSMIARGMIAPEAILAAAEKREQVGDPQAMKGNFLLTGILTRRNHAAVRLEAVGHAPEERGAHGIYVDRDRTVLYEQTSPAGLHHFTIQNVSNSVDLLRTFVLGRVTGEADESATGSDPEEQDAILWRGKMDGAHADPALLEHTGELIAATKISLSGSLAAQSGEMHFVSGRAMLVILQPDPDSVAAEDMAVARSIAPEELDELLELLIGDMNDSGDE